ncbi:FHA domain-containing protein [Skermania sp. ID1734]|uniref:BTAD domain-containing putative transcriptional regulator n=1 Tax=Skermania sp. ID1734 TaxID=2597516 RepID=UPI00117C47F7|nr:BTAD domain-containing putative transcriptional regulator [Skermania sp. ID1734]TSE02115.1 FHA domain-containing protein [Skermania sp. ID1734]
MAILDISVLGPLQVTVDGETVPLGRPKQRAVLGCLMVSRNRALSADSLIAAVWAASPPADPRASLQVYISKLRELLKDRGIDAARVIASAPPGYRLTLDNAHCDVGRFATRKAAGLDAITKGSFAEASRHLFAAMSEWHGPVLADLRDYSFVDPFASALDEDLLTVQTAWAQSEIACGRAAAVVGDLRQLTTDHPYQEPLWAQLITALYVTGRQSDALDACRQLRAVLSDELGIDPSPQIQDLEGKILRQESLDVEINEPSVPVSDSQARTVLETQRHAHQATLRDHDGEQHILSAGTTRIGRHPDNDVVVNDVRASRHHAVIIDTETGLILEDLHSANGIRLNGERLLGRRLLADGDCIRIGSHEYTVHLTT